MNLLPISPASPNSLPADGARTAEPSGENGFFDVLAQQKGRIAGRGEVAGRDPSAPARPADPDEESRTQAPEETLALLAAGALLPWAAAHPDGGTAASSINPAAQQTGKGPRTIASGLPVTDIADRLPTDDTQAETVSGDTRQRPAGESRIRVADPFAHTQAAGNTDGKAPADAQRGMPAIHAATAAAGARDKAEVQPAADQRDLPEIAALRPAAAAIARAPDTPSITDLSGTAPGATLLQGTSLPQTAVPIAATVATPLSSPDWAADFSRQFLSIAQGRDATHAHKAELRLDPPGLGPVRITLHVGDSITNVSFVSPHAVVRQAIENALPQLQQQLDQAGLSLGQANVSDQSPGQQGFDQAAGGGTSGGGRVFTLDGSGAIAAHDSLPTGALPRTAGRLPDALVDTFA